MARWVKVVRARGEALPLRARWCRSFLCRLRGLTFRRALPKDEGLLFVESAESRVGTAIHMLFVFFPIAVVWMTEEGRVVDKVLAKPFRPYYAPREAARYYLEGPPALLDWVRVGDRLTFHEL